MRFITTARTLEFGFGYLPELVLGNNNLGLFFFFEATQKGKLSLKIKMFILRSSY